jgi:hypothetical protein
MRLMIALVRVCLLPAGSFSQADSNFQDSFSSRPQNGHSFGTSNGSLVVP